MSLLKIVLRLHIAINMCLSPAKRDIWEKEKELETGLLLGSHLCVTTGDIKMGKEVRGHSQPLEYHSYNCPYGTGDLGTREVQNQSAVTSRKGTTKHPLGNVPSLSN